MVLDLGISPLAEGVEVAGDHEICRQIGFSCAQGYYYGHPALPRSFVASGEGEPPQSDHATERRP
jgi:EAL domain-containing protein (putative c-di-GMP-specific phosphodiesterase class I)